LPMPGRFSPMVLMIFSAFSRGGLIEGAQSRAAFFVRHPEKIRPRTKLPNGSEKTS
jgi:hypothetical protein